MKKTALYELPKDVNEALKVTMAAIDKLQSIFVEENKALEAHNPKDFVALQDVKFEAAKEYHAIISAIMARKDEIKTADEALKNQMKQKQIEFAEISGKNLISIERMQNATERLGNSIRSAVVRELQQKQTYSYGENGAISGGRNGRAISTGLSETV